MKVVSGLLGGTSDIPNVELHDIHRRLSLAKQLNYNDIICFTDSLQCVDIV